MSQAHAAPRMRASDQDRTEAIMALSDHFAEGRLDQAEFDARMTAASEATYLHEFDPLFDDLPRRSALSVPDAGSALRQGRGQRGMRRHRGPGFGGPPFPLAPIMVGLVIAMVFVFGFKALLFVFLGMWHFGSIARRRAWRRAMGEPSHDTAHWR